MNRNEMFEGIMRQAGLTRAGVRCFYDGLVGMAAKHLARDKEFVLPGLGVLRVRRRKARDGRNPQTGETIRIPAKNVVRFRAYRALNDMLNPPRPGAGGEGQVPPEPGPPVAGPPAQDPPAQA